jgi:hypothetical protein
MYKCVRGIHVLGLALPVMYKCVRGIYVLGVVLPAMYKCVRGIHVLMNTPNTPIHDRQNSS